MSRSVRKSEPGRCQITGCPTSIREAAPTYNKSLDFIPKGLFQEKAFNPFNSSRMTGDLRFHLFLESLQSLYYLTAQLPEGLAQRLDEIFGGWRSGPPIQL